MAYGVQSPNQQSIKPVSRTQNKNQYDAFYFTDFHYSALSTYVDGGVFSTNTSGGAVTVNPTAALTAFGITACSGVVQLSTSTTSNATNAASVSMAYNNGGYNLIAGIQTPTSSSFVSKYEIETLIRTDATIFSSGATLGGYIHCGFKDSLTNSQFAGVFFEYLTDGTTNDTTFWVKVSSLSNGSERTNTSVTVSANTTYRLYLSLEAFTGPTYTITYKIKNITTGASTEGTITPTSNRVPTANSDNMAAMLGIGRATNVTTTAILLNVDYMGVRIRKPIVREILLGTF